MFSNKNIIYADNHASTRIDPNVVSIMYQLMTDEAYGNPSSLDHEYGRYAATILNNSREIIANDLNAAGPENIIFTSGATEANNLVINTILKRGEYGQIIISPFEHVSILTPAKSGFSDVRYIPLNKDYSLNVEKFIEMIENTDGGIDLISCMYANNEIGTIYPIKEISAIARKYKIPFHCDASQALAWKKLDVKSVEVDYLTLSSHKAYGPKGVGVLYVKDGVEIDSMWFGGKQEFKKRVGTENIIGIAGFASAVEYCQLFRNEDSNKIRLIGVEIEKIFHDEFRDIEFSINGGINRLPNNISITFPNLKQGLLELVNKKIAVSDGSACQGGVGQTSHVLTELGYGPKSQTLRIGLGRFTKDWEGEIIAKTIVDAAKKLYKGD